MTKPELKTVSPMETLDHTLLEQLKAIEQPAPSAALDATILRQIETALRDESEAKSQAMISTHTTQWDKNAPSTSQISNTPTWLERLRQWWYLPVVAATASVILSIHLSDTGDASNSSVNHTPTADVEKNSSNKAVTEQVSSARVLDKELADKQLVVNAAKSTGFPKESELTMRKPRARMEDAAISPKPQITSADANSLSKQVFVSTATSPTAVSVAANHAPSVATTAASPASPANSGEVAEKQKEALASQVVPRIENERHIEPPQANKKNFETIVVRASSPIVPTAENSPASAPQKTEIAASNYAAGALNQQETRRVSVTGSRIQRESTDATTTTLAEETLGRAVPEAKMTGSHNTTAPALPLLAPPMSSIATKKVESDDRRTRDNSDDPMRIGQELEKLLAASKTEEALVLWREFKKQHPQRQLSAALEQRLKELDSPPKR